MVEKEWFSTSEMMALGYSKDLLVRIWNTPHQQIAYKTTYSGTGGKIMYNRKKLDEFLFEAVEEDQRRRELI